MELALLISSINEAPQRVRSAAKRALLDTIGAAIAGAATDGGKAALRGAAAIWGTGDARIWFSGKNLMPAGAAFVNSAYASMLDVDDGHRGAAGHPGAAIIPAVAAEAESLGATPSQVLTAIALGYEVALRIASARDINRIRTTDTGRWCGYGVAAAVAWLRELPPDTIAQAMAIAGHTASSQAATGWTKLGHTTKEGIAFSTAAGIAAVDLAHAGCTGPLDLLDDPNRYDQARMIAGMGESWQIESCYFKIYSACRWAHAPIDAALSLQGEHKIDIASIQEVEIGLFARALTLLNMAEPETVEAAQYSIPFCVALAMVHGPSALLPMTTEHLKNPVVTALARRIRLVHRPYLDSLFPASTPAEVTIRHAAFTERLELPAPFGEPSHPLSDRDLEEKFRRLAAGNLPAPTIEELLAALHTFDEEQKTDRLFQAMGETLEPGDHRAEHTPVER
jgi:2-methylcitrate dehydratase PrpD